MSTVFSDAVLDIILFYFDKWGVPVLTLSLHMVG